MLSAILRKKEEQLRRKCREWFLASGRALLSFARQQVDSETDAELLVAEVVQKVMQVFLAGKVQQEEMTPYTLRALHNGAIDKRRKNQTRRKAERRFCEEEDERNQLADPSLSEGLTDEHLLLRRALRQMPEDLAAVITLRIWEELSFAEMAKILNMPETNVRRKYRKGIAVLKMMLNQIS